MSNSKIKIKNVTKLLIKAREQEYENNLWDLWKLQYPQMDKESFISFADYKKEYEIKKMNNFTEISYEEIEKEINQVIMAHEKKGVENN